jgi:hypothetical protein
LFGVLFGVILAVAAFAGPASAAPNAYANPTTVSVSDQTPTAGSSVKFCGQGFQAGETVTIALDNGTTFPSAVADSSGAFCSTLVLGASLSGTHTITATGTTSGATAAISIVVAGVSANAGATSSGGLAFTGGAVLGIGALGALLLIGGAAMMRAGRRRKANA